jgi:hypothetical protein
MTIQSRKYKINNIKQLVDLNGASTNFKLEFKVTCLEKDKEFDCVVIDQTTLDSGETLPYKRVKGSLSGNFKIDNNIYQSYYLILKSDTECEVEVEINFEELPKNVPTLPPAPKENLTLDESPSINWKKILIIVGIIAIIGLVIWIYLSKNPGFNPFSGSNTVSSFPSLPVKSVVPSNKTPSNNLSSRLRDIEF